VLVIPAVDKFANYPYVSGLTPDDVTFKNLANPLAQRDLAYPLNPCAGKGLFANAPMDTAGNRDRCPNGDVTVFGSQCLVNADANSVMPCLGGSLQKPAFVFDDTPVDGMAPSASDGRVYNLIGYANDSSGNPQLLKDSRGREVTGLFGRIHTYRSMNEPDSSLPASTGGYTGVCRDLDATSQIGCLMTASKCSLGYAGREAVAQYPNAVSIKVNAVPDQAACLANLSYSLTRKLYLNTMLGFGNARLATQETALAACFVQNPNAATGINTVIGDKGFLPLPSTPAGAVYCEDFNENMICGGAANVNACAPASNPTWFPSVSTICGNGIVETLEECDWGLTPTTCDKTCRLL
jgi:hypothetical protein